MEHAEPDGRTRPSRAPMTDDALHGRLLDGRYRIGPQIARGGMASVYEALDERLDRVVAVKVMHAGLADAHTEGHDFAERFVREARSAARLSHPNVVAVYDQGDDDNTVFLVMELVSGHTLRDTITKESPMAPSKALALMDPVLSALAAAHRAHLIHRDVKPENVLIANDGRVKVADFGLAKAVSADTQHTATQGVLIGTVSYLAPELVIDGRADARADVYAAGVVLYELLTGTKPHEGESPIQVAYKHVHHDVPPPSALVPDIPAYVDALVARATARDRGLRPADASVLLRQLRRVAQALAEGVRDDPELTLDLAPHLGASGAAAVRPVSSDTTPELLDEAWDHAWDDGALASFFEPTASPASVAPSASTGPSGPEQTRTLQTDPNRPVQIPAPRPPPRKPARTPKQAQQPRPPKPPRARRPRRSRRGPILLVLALLLALGVGGGAYWFGYARYTASPSVAGLDRADAEQQLTDVGLDVTYADAVYSSDIAKDAVVQADPAGGSQVRNGGTVTLTLSLGELLVPKVRGLSEDDAQDALQARQLTVGDRVTAYSEGKPEGTVLASKPRLGTELEPGDTVDLVVSKGREPRKVGRWVGKDINDARAALDKRGLEVVVDSEEYSDDVDADDVISQDPAGGTLFRDEQVHFVVSRGPEPIQVPSVRGQNVSTATATLEAAGFKVKVQENPGFSAGFNIAFQTDPPAGESAPKGATITIYLI